MEPTLDQVREELAGIHDQLLALPRDDFDSRSKLMVRRDELRKLSLDLADGVSVSDPETLKAAFTRLQHVRDTLIETMFPATWAWTGYSRRQSIRRLMPAPDSMKSRRGSRKS